MTKSSDTFRKNIPTVTLADASIAAKSLRVVQSFNAYPVVTDDGKIKALAVKLRYGNGATESFLLGPYAALILRMMLSHLEKNNWTELAIIPPHAKPDQ